MKNYVFTYGTLKDKYPNKEMIPAVIKGNYIIDRSWMYPVIRQHKDVNLIEGYIFQVNENELVEIDRYEGYPELYQRINIPILTEIKNINAWVYVTPNLIKDNNGTNKT